MNTETITTDMGKSCRYRFNKGDIVYLQFDDEVNPPKDITIRSVKLDILKIGN